jgi:hypothetical protein
MKYRFYLIPLASHMLIGCRATIKFDVGNVFGVGCIWNFVSDNFFALKVYFLAIPR